MLGKKTPAVFFACLIQEPMVLAVRMFIFLSVLCFLDILHTLLHSWHSYGMLWNMAHLLISFTWLFFIANYRRVNQFDSTSVKVSKDTLCEYKRWAWEEFGTVRREGLDTYLELSWVIGVPLYKSSIFMGFSIVNHPFWGIPIYGNPDQRVWDKLECDGILEGNFEGNLGFPRLGRMGKLNKNCGNNMRISWHLTHITNSSGKLDV